MKKFIKKFKTTHFDVAAGPMILIFGSIVFIFLAIAVACVLLAIKLIKKAKNDYQKTDGVTETQENKEDDNA